MLYFIAGVIVLAMIGATISVMIAFPTTLAYFGGFIGIGVVFAVVIALIEKATPSYTKEEKESIELAGVEDVFAVLYNNQQNEKLTRQRNVEINAKIKKCEEIRNRLEAERKAVERDLSCSLLDERDQEIYIVDFLIDAVKSRRANSLSDALLQYDAKRARDSKAALDKVRAETQRMILQRQQDQYMNDLRMDQLRHQREMEAIERKKAEELERIRRDQEEIARYGRIL